MAAVASRRRQIHDRRHAGQILKQNPGRLEFDSPPPPRPGCHCSTDCTASSPPCPLRSRFSKSARSEYGSGERLVRPEAPKRGRQVNSVEPTVMDVRLGKCSCMASSNRMQPAIAKGCERAGSEWTGEGGDSNSRDPCGPTGFRNRAFEPLRHLSECTKRVSGGGFRQTDLLVRPAEMRRLRRRCRKLCPRLDVAGLEA